MSSTTVIVWIASFIVFAVPVNALIKIWVKWQVRKMNEMKRDL